MYRGYLQYMQNASPGTFSRRDCVKLVSEDIERWWGQTGIEIITQNGIIKMILSIEDHYKRLRIIRGPNYYLGVPQSDIDESLTWHGLSKLLGNDFSDSC